MTERERLMKILSITIYPREGADPAEVVADFLLDSGVRLPVTCAECEYNDGCMTDFNGFGRKDFDFCPYGERREDNE